MAYLQSFGNNRDNSNFRIKYENGNVYAHTYEGLEYDSVLRMNNYTGVIPKEKIWFKVKSRTGAGSFPEVYLPGTVISTLESGILRVAEGNEWGIFTRTVRYENSIAYNVFSGVMRGVETSLWPEPHTISEEGFYIACHADSLYGGRIFWENTYVSGIENADYEYDCYIESIEPKNLNNAVLPSITLKGHRIEGPLYFQNAKIPKLEISRCFYTVGDILENNGWTRTGITSLDLDGSSIGSLEIRENPALTGITGNFTITEAGKQNWFVGSYLPQETIDHIIDRYYYSIKQNDLHNGTLVISDAYIAPRIVDSNYINALMPDGSVSYNDKIYVSKPLVAPPSSGAIDKLIEIALDYNWTTYYLYYDHLNNPNATDPTANIRRSHFSQISKASSSVGSVYVNHSTGVPINPYRDGIPFPTGVIY